MNQSKEQPIKGWVKATERKPEKGIFPVKVSNKKNTVTMIGVGLVTIGEFSVIRFLNGTTLQEENNGFDDENIEWLDETPIAEGEEMWISVEDDKPKKEKSGYSLPVLVTLTNGDMDWVDIDKYDFYMNDWEKFHFAVPKVISWRPLLKPPNGKSNAGEERLVPKEDLDNAINEIGRLQDQLRDAEDYIKDLKNKYGY